MNMMSNYKPPTIAPPTFSFPNPQYLCFVFWTLVILNPTELNTLQGPVDCQCYLMEIFLHSSSKIFSPKLCGMLCFLVIIPLYLTICLDTWCSNITKLHFCNAQSIFIFILNKINVFIVITDKDYENQKYQQTALQILSGATSNQPRDTSSFGNFDSFWVKKYF